MRDSLKFIKKGVMLFLSSSVFIGVLYAVSHATKEQSESWLFTIIMAVLLGAGIAGLKEYFKL